MSKLCYVMPLFAALTFNLCVCMGTAHASNAQNFFTEPIVINGSGSKTCGDYTQADPYLKSAMTNWFQGFVTGVNATQNGPDRMVGSGLSFETEEALLDKYCRDQPLEFFFIASAKVYQQLRNRALPVQSNKPQGDR